MIFLDSVESTQLYLKEYIRTKGYKNPLAIVTAHQTNGIGSRDNSWDGEKGNLFFSFVIAKSLLSQDIPIQSISIYFSYLLKELLQKMGSQIWLKWPNDFYIHTNKIGGTITNYSNECYYCGIGLNLQRSFLGYGFLDIQIDIKILLQNYFQTLFEKITWKKIFSKYRIEFENSKHYKTTINHKKVSMQNAFLQDDGSIIIENKKVFSLR